MIHWLPHSYQTGRLAMKASRFNLYPPRHWSVARRPNFAKGNTSVFMAEVSVFDFKYVSLEHIGSWIWDMDALLDAFMS